MSWLFTTIILPNLTRIAIGGAIALAFGGWSATIAIKSFNRGFAHAINQIAAKDKAAVAAATKASAALKACNDVGKAWDVVTGTCGEAE